MFVPFHLVSQFCFVFALGSLQLCFAVAWEGKVVCVCVALLGYPGG